ncbi:MAG: hypothetical protein MZU95_17605 [Desulfomicrobium escambiense]|nr:hypothetical protein [Desulfomicrobium escambiense]
MSSTWSLTLSSSFSAKACPSVSNLGIEVYHPEDQERGGCPRAPGARLMAALIAPLLCSEPSVQSRTVLMSPR